MTPLWADRFTPVRALGEGATGRVFEVYDRVHAARCALKQLRPDRVFEASHIAAFKDEFRGLVHLAHSNLAKVYELLVEGSDVFLLMELVDGVDFVRYVRCQDATDVIVATESEQDAVVHTSPGGSLSVERLRSGLPQLVQGVLALHATGRVHGDLKPDNVLIDDSGRVVIVDFGLISVPSYNAQRRPRGTLHYMAPEQMDGWLSEASDWYALGVILYVALTGRFPFGGPAGTIQYEKRFAKFVDPRQLAQAAPDDLCELCSRLLSPDPRERPNGAAIAHALGLEQRHAPSLSAVPSHLFVGRTAPMARLAEALTAVRRGHSRTIFLHGESGIGKTTLLRHFAEQVRREDPSVQVLQGACYQDASVPYKGLDAIMDRIAAGLSQQLPLLEEFPVDAIATMFPVFAHALRCKIIPGERHPLELRKRALASVRALFERLAALAPLVVTIDDFQWTDDETIDLLAEIVRPPTPHSVLLILGHRSSARSHEAERIARARSIIAADDDLQIGPLEHDDVRTLLSALRNRPMTHDAIEQFASDCMGNPLLLSQLALTRTELVGRRATLDEVVLERIGALDEAQRRYVELVSVSGRPVDEHLVARILGVSGSDALAARHHLLGECFIRRADNRTAAVEPYHDQIRERVLKAMPVQRAKSYHARLGSELEACSDMEPETLALHFREAGDAAKALLYTERAAVVAAEALAFDRAAALYDSAASAIDGEASLRLRAKQAEALSNAGRTLEAATVFLDIAAKQPAQVDWRLRAGDELLRAGQLDRGFELLREIARSIGEPLPNSDLLAQLALVWNGWRLFRVRVPEAARRRTPTPAEQQKLTLCLMVARRLAMVDTPAGALFQRRYLLLALEFGSIVDIARGLALEASFCAHMPRFAPGGTARATALNAQCRALGTAADVPDVKASVFFADGMVAYALGRWRESRIAMESAVEVLRREVVVGVRWDVAISQGFIGFMLWMEGLVPAIAQNLPKFMEGAAGDLSLETATAHRVGVMLALCEDDPKGARQLACEMISKWPAGPWRLQHYFDASAQIEIDLYEASLNEAWQRAMDSWKKSSGAGIFQQRFFIPFSLLQHARIALAAGSCDRAAAAISSLDRHDGWARALAQLLRASLTALQGDFGSARRLLAAAAQEVERWELRLYALAARSRLGSLEDPDAMRKANDELAQLGIRNPPRMVDTLLPWPATASR